MEAKEFLADDLHALKVVVDTRRREGWTPSGRFFTVPPSDPRHRLYIGPPDREPTVGQRMIRER